MVAPGGAGGSVVTGTGGSSPADAGSGGATPPTVDSGPSVSMPMGSMMITAKSGGTLVSGGATLVVPAGVFDADKVLTVSVKAPAASDPGRANLVSNIFDFGPDGTTFTVPVSLTLPLTGTVPADKNVVVAWLDTASGQWFPVVSTIVGDKVTGRISHFSRYSLVLLAKDQFCPFAGACGGSLEGTWKYTQACLKPQESEAFKCGSTGGTVMLRQEYTVGGTVTIGQGRFTADQMIQGSATLFYTPACMAVVRESMPTADCTTLQAAWRKEKDPTKPEIPWVCAGSVEQGCSCKLTNGLAQKVAGTVAIEGQKITFNQEGKKPGTADDFCVQGNNLSVKGADGEVYTAIKQ